MILFVGYTKKHLKKALYLNKDRSLLYYEVDDVLIDTFDIKDVKKVLKELDDAVDVKECQNEKMVEIASRNGITSEEIQNLSILNYQPEKEQVNIHEIDNNHEELFYYADFDDMVTDLRRHLDDAINSFAGANNLSNTDWFDWQEAVYATMNYLQAYCPRQGSFSLPCSLVMESCQDSIGDQYEKEQEKEALRKYAT